MKSTKSAITASIFNDMIFLWITELKMYLLVLVEIHKWEEMTLL